MVYAVDTSLITVLVPPPEVSTVSTRRGVAGAGEPAGASDVGRAPDDEALAMLLAATWSRVWAASMPDKAVVCPEDFSTLLWQRSWDKMLELRAATLAPDDVDPYVELMPYWSSYQIVPYASYHRQLSGNLKLNGSDSGVSPNTNIFQFGFGLG